MNCTKCKFPITKGEDQYRVTKKGAHHVECPLPGWAMYPGVYVMRCECLSILAFRVVPDGNSVGGLAIEWAHTPGTYTALKACPVIPCPHCKRSITPVMYRAATNFCKVFGVKVCTCAPVIT